MTKYIEIKGGSIQATDTDPVVYAGSWSSGGSLNTARSENFGNGAGIQTAAAVAGGYTNTNSNTHEQYDGTSWTETTEINTARYGAWADGTQSAFWMAAGYSTTYVNNTETWNGSSWTEVNEVNTARGYGGGTTGRSSTAGLVVAGFIPPNTDSVESWDGTNWTEVSEVNTARRKAGGFGTSTAAFSIGAAPSPSAPATNLVESWNGSAWTETTEINTGRGALGAAGTTTDGLIFGSEQTPRQITESWNGTAWTEVGDMGNNQGNSNGSGGTGSLAWIAGGTDGTGNVATTEEWSFPSAPGVQLGQVWYNTDSATLKGYAQQGAGAWASGGNLNSNKHLFGAVTKGATLTAALYVGGWGYSPSPPGQKDTVESYDGSSWTEITEINTARQNHGCAGIQTLALAFGGGPSGIAASEAWDGSSWAEGPDMNTARWYLEGGLGITQSAAMAVGGYTGSYNSSVEKWDGSSWTEVSELNTTGGYIACAGTTTSGIAIAGEPTPRKSLVESWDGSSWTEISELNTARSQGGGAGLVNTNVLMYGGESSQYESKTEAWNGSSWTEVADLSDSTSAHGSGGSGSGALSVAGQDNPGRITEEWSLANATKTLTVS